MLVVVSNPVSVVGVVQVTPLSQDRETWILLLAQVAETKASCNRTWIPCTAVTAWLAARPAVRLNVPHSCDVLFVVVVA